MSLVQDIWNLKPPLVSLIRLYINSMCAQTTPSQLQPHNIIHIVPHTRHTVHAHTYVYICDVKSGGGRGVRI